MRCCPSRTKGQLTESSTGRDCTWGPDLTGVGGVGTGVQEGGLFLPSRTISLLPLLRADSLLQFLLSNLKSTGKHLLGLCFL